MSKKKLITISKSSGNKVTFYFGDSSTLTCDIDGTDDYTYLYNHEGNNAEVFYRLGIEDPHELYRELGILARDEGECPECKREDLDKIFNYLLRNYSVEPEEPKEEPKQPKKPSEWDWLLD